MFEGDTSDSSTCTYVDLLNDLHLLVVVSEMNVPIHASAVSSVLNTEIHRVIYATDLVAKWRLSP